MAETSTGKAPASEVEKTEKPSGGAIAGLFPGYFALVMATGIVAIACHQHGLDILAEVLFWVAAVGYAVLFVLYLLRLVMYPGRFWGDLTHHATAFAFMTVVAGTNVLGSAAALIQGWWSIAVALWLFSLFAWVALVYPAISGVILRTPPKGIDKGINGTWFVLVVGTQSIAVLGALFIAHYGYSQWLELGVVSTFTLGIVLYLIVVTLVFLRWAFDEVDPSDMQPPSWIAMGAVAISTLAGSNIVAVSAKGDLLPDLRPFLEGMMILAWATAAFWIPTMLVIGVWRHIVKRVPLDYHPSLWGMVFPLGMFSACTYQMAQVTGLTILDPVAWGALGVALVAWTGTFVGLLLSFLPARTTQT